MVYYSLGMDNYRVIAPISPSFSLKILNPPHPFSLTAYEQRRVEQIWDKANRVRGGALFNGKIFSLNTCSEQGIEGYFVDYKYYLAQLLDLSLRKVLPIEAVTINGITCAGNKVLVGRRSSLVTQYGGYLEFVPSGSIDPTTASDGEVDYRKALIQELEEETGIASSEILTISLLALIRCEKSCHAELCLKIFLHSSWQNIFSFPKREYQKFHWVSERDFKKIMKKHPSQIVPLSAILYKEFMNKKGSLDF